VDEHFRFVVLTFSLKKRCVKVSILGQTNFPFLTVGCFVKSSGTKFSYPPINFGTGRSTVYFCQTELAGLSMGHIYLSHSHPIAIYACPISSHRNDIPMDKPRVVHGTHVSVPFPSHSNNLCLSHGHSHGQAWVLDSS